MDRSVKKEKTMMNSFLVSYIFKTKNDTSGQGRILVGDCDFEEPSADDIYRWEKFILDGSFGKFEMAAVTGFYRLRRTDDKEE